MEIEPLQAGLISETPLAKKTTAHSFGELLSQGIHHLNQLQVDAQDQANHLAAGEDLELHDVMIAAQEAEVALRLATQLRTQVLEAYREILRMPI